MRTSWFLTYTEAQRKELNLHKILKFLSLITKIQGVCYCLQYRRSFKSFGGCIETLPSDLFFNDISFNKSLLSGLQLFESLASQKAQAMYKISPSQIWITQSWAGVTPNDIIGGRLE